MKKVYIKTFGCQMNEYDSLRMAGALFDKGYYVAEDEKSADIVIVNTCSVREHAEKRALNYARAWCGKKNVVAAGCMAQKMERDLLKKIPGLHAVVGTFNFEKIEKAVSGEKGRVYTDMGNETYLNGVRRKNGLQGYLTVMQGCNNFCSYCIVPYVRGGERSRTPDDILLELKKMGDSGFKEVTLLGQNVNSYFDKKSSTRFPELLRACAKVEGIERIRFMTSHPKDLNDELIDAAASEKKVCPHFHLPVQSGSNRILKLMNRKYTVEEYKEKVEKIRAKVQGVAITTDIIAGFPGETEKDFDDTACLIGDVRFDDAFVFKYSAREGTKAAEYADDVAETEKLRRVNYILDLQKKIGEDINKKQVGTVVEALITGGSLKTPQELKGIAGQNKRIFIDAQKGLFGRIVKVRITGVRGKNFKGVLI